MKCFEVIHKLISSPPDSVNQIKGPLQFTRDSPLIQKDKIEVSWYKKPYSLTGLLKGIKAV